jgi:hypothetical protein
LDSFYPSAVKVVKSGRSPNYGLKGEVPHSFSTCGSLAVDLNQKEPLKPLKLAILFGVFEHNPYLCNVFVRRFT